MNTKYEEVSRNEANATNRHGDTTMDHSTVRSAAQVSMGEEVGERADGEKDPVADARAAMIERSRNKWKRSREARADRGAVAPKPDLAGALAAPKGEADPIAEARQRMLDRKANAWRASGERRREGGAR
jgi:hypothetical protein